MSESFQQLSIQDLQKVRSTCWAARRKWMDVGIELKLNKDDLDTIRHNYSGDVETCFTEMLTMWLKRTTPPPNMAALILALKQPPVGMNQLAESLDKTKISGPGSFEDVKLKFPHIKNEVRDECTREELERRLRSETQDIMYEFFALINKFFDSLEEQNLPVPRLLRYLSSPLEIDTFSPEPKTVNNVCKIIKQHSSFFNYRFLQYMIESAGTIDDKQRSERYHRAFICYAQRRIYECPSTFGATLSPSDTELHVKLDSRYDKYSVNELHEFQDRLSVILQRQVYIFRLLSAEKGCFKLVYAIPLRLKQAIFPLQDEQKKALTELGVLQLICGTCYFSSNTFQAYEAHSDVHDVLYQTPLDQSRNSREGVRDRRRASESTKQGLDLLADERTKEVLDKTGAALEIGDNPAKLRIAVVGKTGVGKTTLIKSLFDNDVPRPQAADERNKNVDTRKFDIDSPSGRQIEVTVKDTPGTDALVGIGSKTNCKQYVQEVSTSIKEADIILYCLRMDQYVSESDVGTLRFFLEEFRERVWVKVMIVLTCANKVVSEIPEEYKQQIFDSRFESMQTDLRKAMQQAGISEEVAKATPICVAGSPWNKSLPGCDDWVCPFLVNCLKSGVTDNTKAALLHSTWKRWITTRRKITGTATGAGVVTGLGLVVIGGVMSAHPIGLPLGVPLLAVGAGISIYSASASAAQATVSERKHSKDMETANKIQKLQPGDHL